MTSAMMTVNPMLAAGLFDSPWVVAAIIIVGAFVNWLSQLRQQKKQREEEQQSPEAEAGSPGKPAGSFDVEEALRRLLGEEASEPTIAPPPIPRATGAPPFPPVRQGRAATVLVPPPIAMARPTPALLEVSDVERQTAQRFAQTNEQVQLHLVTSASRHRARGSNWSGLWRDRSSVRRAFVGSLVFGPPKGLES